MKTKILTILLLLGISSTTYAFKIKVSITVIQSDAVIYVNNEYKSKGKYEFDLREAKPFMIRIEKHGFKTESRIYKYNASINSGFFNFTRNDLNITIDLKPDSPSPNTFTEDSNGTIDKSQELVKLETLKDETLITDEEHLTLKDNLLSNANNQNPRAISELMKLRKLLNLGTISKLDFISIKNKIVNNQYDYSNGKSAPDRLEELKAKSESGDYSKEEIEKLKKVILNSYK